ncbi:MAG: hypothetical protein RLZZ596_1573 [Pseudomonadota bacterium]
MLKRRLIYLILALLPTLNQVQAEDRLPNFMTSGRHIDAQAGEKLAYTKGVLETIAFVLYSYGATSSPDYQRILDCYKERFRDIVMTAHMPWIFAKMLDKPLAYLIYHDTTPSICKVQSVQASPLRPATLKITYFSEWSSWSESEKMFYVGGFIDGGATINREFSHPDSKRMIERLKSINFKDTLIKEIVAHADAEGLRLDSPLPWSISVAFGKVLGKNPSPLSAVNEEHEKNKTAQISFAAHGSYIDARIMSEICQEHLVNVLTPETLSGIKAYENSMQCYGERSISNLVLPLMVSYGVSLGKAEQITAPMKSAFLEKLPRVKVEYAKLGASSAKAICLDMVKNHRFSRNVLAEKLDAMHYQFGRLSITKGVFDSYMKSVASCPKVYSLENSVPAPAFLQ